MRQTVSVMRNIGSLDLDHNTITDIYFDKFTILVSIIKCPPNMKIKLWEKSIRLVAIFFLK